MNEEEIRAIVRAAMEEQAKAESARVEVQSEAQLRDERQKSETLQKQLADLMSEGQQLRVRVDEAEKNAVLRGELQRLGVQKVDLAYRAIREDIRRAEDGKFQAASGEDLGAYLMKFVGENPELLPARLAGGSGASSAQRASEEAVVDIDKIRPGMNPAELERMRQEIARVALRTMRGL